MLYKFKKSKKKNTFNKLIKKQNPIKPSLLSIIALEISENNKYFR